MHGFGSSLSLSAPHTEVPNAFDPAPPAPRDPAPPRHPQPRPEPGRVPLILPLFLVFVAACLDLGRVFYANISLNNAARERAMQAASKTVTFIQDGPCDAVNNTVVCRVQFASKGS